MLIVHPGASFSVSDVYEGWFKGLEANGCDVASYGLDERLNFYANAKMKRGNGYVPAFVGDGVVRMAANGLKSVVYDLWPDVVLIVSAFFVPLDFYEVLRARGQRVVLLHTEAPYENDKQLERARYADLNLLNDPTDIAKFQAVAPTIYMPHAYDSDRHFPREADPALASDFCFVGTGYASRTTFFESVDWEGIDAKLAGNWQATQQDSPLRPMLAHPVDECCPNEETVRLYASTKCSANLYRKEAQRPELSEGWSMSPREVEMAACRTFFLRERRGEGDEVLPMLPRFEEPAEFGDLVRWWSSHDEKRREIAAQAQQAIEGRTFSNNARTMLRALERLTRR